MTPRGNLIAFTEGRRKARGDLGDVGIILRRSTDCGVTGSGRRNNSAMARREDWYWSATGSAAGIPIRSRSYSNRVEIDGDRVSIMYDRHPRLSYRTFFPEDCA